MNMASQIVVDTEDLDKKAKRLSELGGIFDNIGSRINGECLSVPSYDGQLLDPAKGAASQVLYETGAMRDALKWYGDFMSKSADQFEKTDNTSIEYYINFYWDSINQWLNAINTYILGEKPYTGDPTNGYEEFLAYEEDGSFITIWFKGQPIRIDFSDPSLDPLEREKLAKSLAEFKTSMQGCLEHLDNYLGGNEGLVWAALGLINSGFKIPDIISMISKFEGLANTISGNEDEVKKALEDYNAAMQIWQELNSQDVPGKVPVS
jgi:hypothetical protein